MLGCDPQYAHFMAYQFILERVILGACVEFSCESAVWKQGHDSLHRDGSHRFQTH